MTGLAIIGPGRHVEKNILPALARIDGLKLRGMWGRSREKTEALSEAAGCKAYPTLAAALGDSEVSTVYIATPVGLHAEHARAALEAGKHVWCEKTLTSSMENWESLAALAEQKGLALFECFMFPFHPQWEALMRMIREGEIGALRSVTARFACPHFPRDDIRYNSKIGGGALWDVGCYPIKAAGLLAGEAAVENAVFRLFRDPGYDVDTRGGGVIYYSDGIAAHLEWGFGLSYRSEVEAWGEKGWLRAERLFTKPDTLESRVVLIRTNGERKEIFVDPANHFTRMFEALLREQGISEQRLRRTRNDVVHGRLLAKVAKDFLF